MKEGIIVKGIGGFYYIKCGDNVYECRARGIFRKKNIKPLVGDYVKFTLNNENSGVIEEILDRKSELLRPPVANVEHAIIVFAAKNPEPNMILLDKMLVLGEVAGLKLTICINKIDLDENGEIIKKIQSIYKNTGYNIIFSSTKNDLGIDDIKNVLKNKITVFAGPSGVGKSSILNAVQSNLKLKTGDISRKIKRGKHTTRHTELLELDFGGWVVDTPGFTSLNIDFIESEKIAECFPEFRKYLDECKFTDCMHINEPDCKVKEALDNGFISKQRYENYVSFVKQILENNRR
ncbi:ribosome biogenesis GTPase [Caminicella sporogenes DSM 14501]|uniref:Small ribosomal subunit biogenesis GTPase RsgA n=2 Tax=Caminicella TaxID=166484 RepID=A0A1M6LHF4_9FIRM|nr:ribosome small subunit-dependent GTPase A [Caminicella sporogenes]RKD27832.1 ribosome small subunit-dependent GTPase A [Caminicella sporogenes]SHJ70616.1 ribosome biogenesis GTPase [Caminicella sporogenes DSM 14501]